MTQATAALAQFTSALEFAALPKPVLAQARLCLLNILGCAIAGAREPVVDRAARALLPHASPGSSTLVARKARTEPISAAFVNCLASAVLAFDETHARCVLHPVGPVAAAALALAEQRHCTGAEFLAALIAGVEVASRASLAISATPARVAAGWSQSGVCGGIGAAAGVARLLELPERSTADAIALGANASAGLRAMNGSPAVCIAVANAAANGYRAGLLAAAGVSGSPAVLEDPYGFVALYSPAGHVPWLTEKLGQDFAVMELNFKPYPCGVVAHPAIDAAREIRSRPGFAADDVEEVTVTLHSSCLSLGDRPVVTNENEASVSIQFWVATALLRANVGPECLGAGWIADTARQQLQQRVKLKVDDSLSRAAARMSMRLRSGEALRSDITNCLGSEANPMRADDLEAKFTDAAAAQFEPARIRNIIEACRSFEQVEDVADFMRLLEVSA
jgi:2-methylcitrate dehydratase PrpD